MSVAVEASYWIYGEETEVRCNTFLGNSAKEGRTGLPVGSVPFKPSAGDSNYCGLHDQGHLLPPKEHGSLCELLSCVKQAKEFNDDFLTSKLSKNYTADSFGADSKPSKRPRK